jgi:ankyrin repeat protein
MGVSSFTGACSIGNLKSIENIIEDFKKKSNQEDKLYEMINKIVVPKTGWTNLTLAARNGHIKVVEYLLQINKSANLDVINKFEESQKQNGESRDLVGVCAEFDRDDVIKMIIEDLRKEEKGTVLVQYTINKVDPILKQNPLQIASKFGKEKVVKYLLSNPEVKVNQPDEEGYPPLHLAAINGQSKVSKLLLDHPDIDVNSRNKEGYLALTSAYQSKSLNTLRVFCEHDRVNLNSVEKDGGILLHHICQEGNDSALSVAIESDYVDINKPEIHLGATPLYVAADSGHANCVSALLFNSKLQPDKEANTGWSPLHIACANGHLSVVQMLTNDERVNVSKLTKDSSGLSPLAIACVSGQTQVVEYLLSLDSVDPNLEGKDELTPLFNTIQSNQLDILKILLDCPKVDPNKQVQNMNSIILASRVGNIDLVKALLSCSRIDINRTFSQENITPLHAACLEKHTQTVQLLLKNPRIDCSILDSYERSTFYTACLSGVPEIPLEFRKLDKITHFPPLFLAILDDDIDHISGLAKEESIDVNQEIDNLTPLHLACALGKKVAIRILLSSPNIQVDYQNKLGVTPFYLLCHNGFKEIAQLAIYEEHFRKTIDIPDKQNRSPLWISAWKSQGLIVKSILTSGVKIDPNRKGLSNEDNCLYTPKEVSVLKGFYEITHLFDKFTKVDPNLKL